jgi:hypothetical protein
MPYEGEFAKYRPLRRIVESEKVRSLLGAYHIRDRSGEPTEIEDMITLSSVKPSEWLPSWVLAIDGSFASVPLENGYPGAEAAYLTVASVLINTAKVRELDQARPANPVAFRATEQADAVDCAIPGCNVVWEGEETAIDSMRRSLLEVMAGVRLSEEGETLLETYEALLAYKPVVVHEQRCPYEDCPISAEYHRGLGQYPCGCIMNRSLYSTDALRHHEGMNAAGSNEAMYAEIMQVLERLWLIHILRTMESRGWLSMLRHMAIVMDGPLAVYDHPSWISQSIYRELCRLNEMVRKATGGHDMLIIGVEKSGAFTRHLADLDTYPNGTRGRFPGQRVALLDDGYIKRNIIFSTSEKPYAQNTHFGRKFLYKTRSGALIVAMTPFLSEQHKELSTAELSQYPRLADALSLLDQMVSSMYPDSFAPLVSAHAEAAIPLSMGNRVLENLAKQLMSEVNA